jgi:cytosine deaminase
MTVADILVTDARIPGTAHPVEIAIADGRYIHVGAASGIDAARVVDAAGSLVTPSFVNPHLHLCKVWTLPMMGEEALAAYHGKGMSEAAAAIDLAAAVKLKYDASWIVPNARRAAALAALYGNLHIRAFADVDGKAKLEGVKALLAVREEFRGVVDIQVVAFAQDGIVREPGTDLLMRQAMELGCDVVGGIPWIEDGTEAAQAHIDSCFDLAAAFDADVSMLLDDVGDANQRTLEMMARTAIGRGWEGRALAHHCRAMALYPEAAMADLTALLSRADVSVVSDPHTGPLHARVRDLLAGGVNVCLGQDDISDAYYPLGRNNMLEVAFLALHLLWMTSRADTETLLDMITTSAARAMNVPAHAIAAGNPANLVVLGQPDVTEALRFHARPDAVIARGRLLDPAHYAGLAGISLKS